MSGPHDTHHRTDDRPVTVEVHPATAERWDDVVKLFGERGAYSGCWCMWWRLPQSEFNRGVGAPNRAALQAIVAAGRVPGLLAYHDGVPVGWCAVAPREEFGRLQRSPNLRPLDDQPVWSIVCFFIDRKWRGQGVGAALLRAAVRFAAAQGATVVEGYPVDPGQRRLPTASAFTGVVGMFEQAGFREVARRAPTRPIMRYRITSDDVGAAPPR